MLIHAKCPACGDDGNILLKDSAERPRCRACGQAFAVISLSPESVAGDDEILSWLAQAGEPDEPEPGLEPEAGADCYSCGFSGQMGFDALSGISFCPACSAIWTPKKGPLAPEYFCPECGAFVEILESDRGKTMLCPQCRYFLGCLLPNKSRHQPFGQGWH